jgi:hypothetical protein
MYFGHESLRMIAAKQKVDTTNLEPGEFVIFLNRAQNAFKLMTGKVVVYYKDSRRIDLSAIRFIPLVFNAKEMDVNYNKALEMALGKKLKR